MGHGFSLIRRINTEQPSRSEKESHHEDTRREEILCDSSRLRVFVRTGCLRSQENAQKSCAKAKDFRVSSTQPIHSLDPRKSVCLIICPVRIRAPIHENDYLL